MTEQDDFKQEKKQTRFKNTIHLWEFLLELLEDEQFIPLISWTRKELGEFKLKNQEEVAKKWGRLKQRAGMNYDKLSRALRYYYQKGIIQKVPGQRLVYRFHKLPYEYRPIRNRWPWNSDPLPREEPHPPSVAPIPVVMTTQWPFVSAFKPEHHSSAAVLSHSSSHTDPLTGVGMVTRRHAQSICRSQVIFPPCTCIGPTVLGVGMIPEPSHHSLQGSVITARTV